MKEKVPKILSRGTAATILTIIGGIGVIATAVAAVKATPRAVDIIRADSRVNHDGDPYGYTKKEAIVSAWKCYIPAAAIGVKIAASEPVARRKRATHAGEVSHAISRKKLHGKI